MFHHGQNNDGLSVVCSLVSNRRPGTVRTARDGRGSKELVWRSDFSPSPLPPHLRIGPLEVVLQLDPLLVQPRLQARERGRGQVVGHAFTLSLKRE